jgi:hypothetical protein
MAIELYLAHRPKHPYPAELDAPPPVEEEEEDGSAGDFTKDETGLAFVTPAAARAVAAAAGREGPRIMSFEEVVQYDSYVSQLFPWPGSVAALGPPRLPDWRSGWDPKAASSPALLDAMLAASNDAKRRRVDAELAAAPPLVAKVAEVFVYHELVRATAARALGGLGPAELLRSLGRWWRRWQPTRTISCGRARPRWSGSSRRASWPSTPPRWSGR